MGCRSGLEITLFTVDESTEPRSDFCCPASWLLCYFVTKVVFDAVTEMAYL